MVYLRKKAVPLSQLSLLLLEQQLLLIALSVCDHQVVILVENFSIDVLYSSRSVVLMMEMVVSIRNDNMYREEVVLVEFVQ
jgi:hypothetical protein